MNLAASEETSQDVIDEAMDAHEVAVREDERERLRTAVEAVFAYMDEVNKSTKTADERIATNFLWRGRADADRAVVLFSRLRDAVR